LLSYMAWAFIQSATTACIISHYKKKSTLFDCRVFLSEETIEYYMVHLGGFILDLTVGFWLLWPKSRPLALFFATSFHMMNAQLFTIGIYSSLLFTTLRWKGGKKTIPLNLIYHQPKTTFFLFKRNVPLRLSGHITCVLWRWLAKTLDRWMPWAAAQMSSRRHKDN
jgi:hypothetical protein